MDVSRVDHEIATGGFFNNDVLLAAMTYGAKPGKALHLMGLLSDGQVHSSQQHLYALLRMARKSGVERVFIHCFLDGRDHAAIPGRHTCCRNTKADRGTRLRADSHRSLVATTQWIATNAGSGPNGI